VTTLADAVLPLIRTRADLYRWSLANAHGRDMHEAVDILEAALPTTDPVEAHRVTERALTSALKVIARADDSSGIIGDACRRLLALHPTTAAAARVPVGKLVDWMMAFQFDGIVDYFELDVVDYAPALGDIGLRTYRQRLDAYAAGLGPRPAEPISGARNTPESGSRWTGTPSGLRSWPGMWTPSSPRTLGRGTGRRGWRMRHTRWTRSARGSWLASGPARQRISIGVTSRRRLRATGASCLRETARMSSCRRASGSSSSGPRRRLRRIFTARRRPNGRLFKQRCSPSLRRGPTRPSALALHTLKDPALAWRLAHELDLSSDPTWSELAKAYERVDPLAVLPVHARLVENELVTAGAEHYRRAARRLAKMRTLAAGSAHATEVDALIADLRRTHYRRPRLQQEFDRAHLP
jgi:hypothetical protein